MFALTNGSSHITVPVQVQGVAQVYAAIETQENIYIVMELCTGELSFPSKQTYGHLLRSKSLITPEKP